LPASDSTLASARQRPFWTRFSTLILPGDEFPGFELWPFQERVVRDFLSCWWRS